MVAQTQRKPLIDHRQSAARSKEENRSEVRSWAVMRFVGRIFNPSGRFKKPSYTPTAEVLKRRRAGRIISSLNAGDSLGERTRNVKAGRAQCVAAFADSAERTWNSPFNRARRATRRQAGSLARCGARKSRTFRAIFSSSV